MAPLNVNQRLRIVDDRIALVDRRIGFLQARFFWRQSGVDATNTIYPWKELPTFEVKDSGFGGGDADGQSFGSEAKEKLFTVKINKTWWEVNRANELRYEYGFTFRDDDKLLPCALLSESSPDDDTATSLQFREVKLGKNFLQL
jgi:hypothetical protein